MTQYPSFPLTGNRNICRGMFEYAHEDDWNNFHQPNKQTSTLSNLYLYLYLYLYLCIKQTNIDLE